MLKYLVQLTSDLLAQALIIGMLSAYIVSVIGKRGRNVLIVGGVLTFIASAAMAYAKNSTKIITSNALDYWNLYTVAVFAGSFLLFLIFSIDKLRVKMSAAGDYIVSILAALIIGSAVFYTLPTVLAYPFNFDLGGETMLSTNFLYRIIGILLGKISSLLAIVVLWKPYYLFTSGFKESVSIYWKGVCRNYSISIVAFTFATYTIQFIPFNPYQSLWEWGVYAAIGMIIFLIIDLSATLLFAKGAKDSLIRIKNIKKK